MKGFKEGMSLGCSRNTEKPMKRDHDSTRVEMG